MAIIDWNLSDPDRKGEGSTMAKSIHHHSTRGADVEPEALRHSTVLLMAITVGVVVANIYYAQPLLSEIARTFGLKVTGAGAIAMLSQAGTAIGMFLFVPLGDKYERRFLIIALLLCCFASLALMATAQNTVWLAAASFAVGATASCVHIVVPFAAHLATSRQRGRVVGAVVAGILFGVLLARTFSGTLGALFGWRAVYGIAAIAMLVLAAVVRIGLPVSPPELALSWRELMRSTWDLVFRHPSLRESAILGALFFAAFSAFWTTLVFFLQSPAYQFGSGAAVAGLFGLVGAAGALGAPGIGHLAHKHGPRFTVRIALWVALVSFAVMAVAGKHLAGLIIGVVLMDLGVQSGHVSNQTRIYGIDPNARSRLNMVYMVCYFVGGGLGSWLGALCWHFGGWLGVCGFGMAALIIAIVVEWFFARP
jgi:predicted MFS family arabinose efflux permease